MRNFNVRTHVNFTRVNEIEAMYKSSRIKVKVEQSLTFIRHLPYIASILFTRVKFTLRNFSVRIHLLYYYMRNFCNLIGLEQWYFSLI